MVKDVSTKKAKIEKVIDDYGSEITLIPIASETYSEDTGWSETTSASVVHTVVPYDYFEDKMNFQPQGNLPEGAMRFISKAAFDGVEKDTLTYDSRTFIITRVNPLPLAGVDLAKVVEVVEKLQ